MKKRLERFGFKIFRKNAENDKKRVNSLKSSLNGLKRPKYGKSGFKSVKITKNVSKMF